MKIRFLGATGGVVSGSCTQFHHPDSNIQFLVDCGVVQGEPGGDARNKAQFPFEPYEIAFVILTHAHLDHCGLIPKLYRDGFKGKVYCSTATAKLAKASLVDGAKFGSEIYSLSDVDSIRFHCIDEDLSLGEEIRIGSALSFYFTPTAHLVGSCAVRVEWMNPQGLKQNIVMSGDLGNNTEECHYQSLLPYRQRINIRPDAIVVESTYGGKMRSPDYKNVDNRRSVLRSFLQDEIFNKRSLVVVPAFAMQRTQELLLDLYVVLRQFFNDAKSSATPARPLEMVTRTLTNFDVWHDRIHQHIQPAIDALPDLERLAWLDAIEVMSDDGRPCYRIKESCGKTRQDLIQIISSTRRPYPVRIVLDAPLARVMSKIIGNSILSENSALAELKEDEKNLLIESLGVTTVHEAKVQLNEILGCTEEANKSFTLHSIEFKREFLLPKPESLENEGCILITGGGMCDGGPIVGHLRHLFGSGRDFSFVSTGYLSEQSLGGRIATIARKRSEGLENEIDDLRIGDESFTADMVKARLFDFAPFYSGHADEGGLLDFVFNAKEEQSSEDAETMVFINHGSNSARLQLRKSIESRSSEARSNDRRIGQIHLPGSQQLWYNFESRRWEDDDPSPAHDLLLRSLLRQQTQTNILLRQLLAAQTAARLRPNNS